VRLALRVLVQADQVVQVAQLEIVQVGIAAVLADRVQADQVVPVVLVVKVDQVVQAQIVQVGIAVVLVDLVLQVLAAVSLVRAHQVELRVELRVAHQVAGQVVDRIQPAVVETRRVRLVNLAVGHQRVASQSEQSVKSLTT
jgi:uncharacterized membrane protein